MNSKNVQSSSNLEEDSTVKPETLRQMIDSVENKILTIAEQNKKKSELEYSTASSDAEQEQAEVEKDNEQNEQEEVKSAERTLFDLEINKEVQQWIEFFTVRDHDRFQRYLNRGERYREVVQTILEENDLPNELFYLGIIESGFVAHAKSRARAVGAWQFMKGTAKLYGLDINNYVDERRDPIRSTESAARYLSDLYKMFNSWELAIASYNCGPGRVLKAIKRGRTRDYWQLVKMRLLPRETRHYLPQFVAAVIIGQNPQKFGLEDPVDSEEANYPSVEAVEVPALVSLTDVSRLSGISMNSLKNSNPHLKRGMTPPGSKTYELWVPKEKSELVISLNNQLSKLAKKNPQHLSLYASTNSHQHRVRRGDNLLKIASLYGISLDYLKEINQLENNMIRPGQTLRLSAKSYRAGPKGSYPYKVRHGDTLEKIAKRYKVSIEQLKELNGLSSSRIYAKQKLIIPSKKNSLQTTRDPAESTFTYRVRRGDTLSKLARKFSLSVNKIKYLNKLHKAQIRVGQKLNIAINNR